MQEIIVGCLFLLAAGVGIVMLLRGAAGKSRITKKQKKTLIRITVSALALFALGLLPANALSFADALFAGAGDALLFALYFAVYLVIGFDILKKAFKGVKNRQLFDESFLMTVATVGAFALAVYERSGDYTEAIAVMLFYQIGEWFQSYAVAKSRRSIGELMDIRPDYANVEGEDGALERVEPGQVQVGGVIVVRPGEKIPIDGTVIQGESSLDTSALTGESIPNQVSEGDEVFSGSVNMTGVIKIRTTKEFGESTVSKILELVENASSRKSRSESFISKFARVYTPVVCLSALLLAVLPPVALLLAGSEPSWGAWIYRALTFLVISCPCALVISIPLSFFAGIGGASSAGVLIKGSNYIEALARAQTVVFDKTGTLTQGAFEVSSIHHGTLENDRLLRYAALSESASSHPISKSLIKAYGAAIDRSSVSDIKEISGKGVIATVDGRSVAVGNSKLMEQLGTQYIPCHSAGTIIHMAIDGEYACHIVISDVVKPTSAQAIEELKRLGVTKTVMLTGDIEKAARPVAEKLGVDETAAELLPADKVEKTEQLLARKPKGSTLVFVGDGINDAPVLMRADVGIAMGAMGSDAAIEAADVVLMDDDPKKIPKAIRLAKKCMRIVRENIVFAIGIKLICLILGAAGLADMWLAIFADVGVMVIAVLNAVRALSVKKL